MNHADDVGKIDPVSWYSFADLDMAGLDVAGGLIQDEYQFVRRSKGNFIEFLGASVLNYCIRHYGTTDLETSQRYLPPIEFAKAIETDPTEIVSLIDVVRMHGREEYVVDVNTLHDRATHYGIDRDIVQEFDTDDIIWIYRLSGNQEFYRQAIKDSMIALVTYVASEISSELPSSISMDDLINEGNEGVLQSAETFSFEEETRFSTYASLRIRGSMMDYLRGKDWLPRSLRTNIKTINEVEQDFELSHGRLPTMDELTDLSGLTPEEITDAYEGRLARPKSLHYSFHRVDSDDDDSVLIDSIPDQTVTEDMEIISSVRRALATLPADELEIVIGIEWGGRTLKELGQERELSESRMSQIYDRIKTKLANNLDLQEL